MKHLKRVASLALCGIVLASSVYVAKISASASGLTNLCISKEVFTSCTDTWYTDNAPLSRLTDEQKGADSDCGIVSYDSLTGLVYEEVRFDLLTKVNQVKLYFDDKETKQRPKDLAVDVLLENNTWKRTAELHNIDYSDKTVLEFNFEETDVKNVRITANNKRNSSSEFRLTEIEIYNNNEIKIDDYTGVVEDKNYIYNIPLPETVNINIAIDKKVSTSCTNSFYLNDYPASRLTDVAKAENSACAIIDYNTSNLGYYEIDLGGLIKINNVIMYLSSIDTSCRPKDFAVDVLQANGVWKRVAEMHGIAFNGNTPLDVKFQNIEGKRVRITANCKRVMDSIPVGSNNFRLTEAEIVYNPQITEYTGADADSNDDYNIPIPDPILDNLALNKTVNSPTTTDWYKNNGYSVSNITDGKTSNAVINYETSGLAYYEIDLESLTELNRVTLILGTAETNKRPKDIAVDILQKNGVWKRAAELHNIEYDSSNKLKFAFENIKGKKIRVTANKKRVTVSDNFRLQEIEAYLDPTVTEYTGAVADSNNDYNIPIPEPILENLALNKTVNSPTTTEWYKNNGYSVSNITDGKTSNAVINYETSGLAYYEIDLESLTELNRVTLVLGTAETNKRPKDIAVDILQNNGVWKRVAELHNIEYDSSNKLKFAFENIKGTKIRVTANKNRVTVSDNFRLQEIEAYLDPTVTEYTGAVADSNNDYNIPIPDPILENYALNRPVTSSNVDKFYSDNFPASNLTDGKTTNAIIGLDAKHRCYYEIELENSTEINRVMLKFNSVESNIRPKDIAFDVLQSNGVWERVAELHNIKYDSSNLLRITFEPIKGKRLRITANLNRTIDETGINNVNFRLIEAEIYNDPTVTEYTGIDKETNNNYSIPTLDPILENLALDRPVSSSNVDKFYTDNFPVERITDGKSSVADSCAIIGYNAKHRGYYEIKLAGEKELNRIMLYFSSVETNLRPQDIAVDVLQPNGVWNRVAELHNYEYDATEPLRITFEKIKGTKIRITANGKRVIDETGIKNVNFRLVEVAAFNDPTVKEYTSIDVEENKDYSIPTLDPELENLALNRPVTTSNVDQFYTKNFPATALTDGVTSVSNAGTIIGYDAKYRGYYEIELAGVKELSRIMLYFSSIETNLRPQDIAVDVLQPNGYWIRVAELHNYDYDETEPLRITFKKMKATKIRITANGKRVIDETGIKNVNFRLVEVAAFNDPTVKEYSTVQNESNKDYFIPTLDPILENLALNRPVSSSNLDAFYSNNFPLTNLTDGKSAVNSSCAIIGFDDKHRGYYEIELAGENTFNRIMLYQSNLETNIRPKDLAVDVLQANGVWKRVAELHNYEYDAAEPVRILFEAIKGKKIRITANGKRVIDETQINNVNFRLTEVGVFYDPTVKEYTGIDKETNTDYSIPFQISEINNLLLNQTVQTSKLEKFYEENYPAVALTDGEKTGKSRCGIINYELRGWAYYEIALQKPTNINTVRTYFSLLEPDYRPLDLALDIQEANGTWKRVAELHNINYDEILADNTVLILNFKEIKASKIRITANRKRNRSMNFRLVEIEAGYDISVTPDSYAPIMKLDDNKYKLLTPDEMAEIGKTKTKTKVIEEVEAKVSAADNKAKIVPITNFNTLLICIGALILVVILEVLFYFLYIRKKTVIKK